MLLSACVVTRNQRELALEAIASLERALAAVDGDTEIVLVANGSDDGTADAVRNRFPNVRIRELDSNRGFAGGLAEGVRATTGAWVLTLNDDATIEPEAARRLLDAGQDDDRIGAVAAKILFADGSETINSAGIAIDRLGIAYDRLLGLPSDAAGNESIDVFGASAGAALLRRAMLETIGGVDESMFMYLEDVDLAWRARALRWRAVLAPEALVYHHHASSAKHRSDYKYFLVGRNRVRLLAKYVPTRHLLRYGLVMVAYDLAYVAYVGVADRTTAPLRGRLCGLREWRRCRRSSDLRDCSAMERSRGLGAALNRRATWTAHSAGAAPADR